MNGCKIDHGPDGFPQFLCRTCHPELVPTAAQRAAAEQAERAALAKQREAEDRKRQHAKAVAKLNSITRNGTREPEEGSVNEKIAKSMRKKIARLEKEMAAC